MAQVQALVHALEKLRKSFSGELITPADPTYEAARHVWNGTIDRRPALIVRCASRADVSAAVAMAREHDLLLAVRGGGHSFPGFSTCDGGLVIDLSPMRKVEVDTAAKTATVEGGALWAELDAATQAHGLAVTGGAVSHTGVAGLTLGGGMGWLMRKADLTCDNLTSAEVVTADGRHVRASAHENPDLFWALRGGGGNFGVVTNFEFRLHEVAMPAVAMMFYPPERGRAVLEAYREWGPSCPDETGSILIFLNAPPLSFLPKEIHLAPFFVLVAPTFADQARAEATLAPMLKLGPAFQLITPMPYTVLQSSFDEPFPHGVLLYQKSQFLSSVSAPVIDGLLDAAARKTPGSSMIQLWSGGGAYARVPDEETPFMHRKAPFLLDVLGVWNHPSQADSERTWVRRTWEAGRPAGSGAYVNFISELDPDRVVDDVYGRSTYQRLAEIKARWDPGNVFRLNQNIAPARK